MPLAYSLAHLGDLILNALVETTKSVETIKVVVLGGGGHAEVVIDIVEAMVHNNTRCEVVGFLDDSPTASLLNLPRLGDLSHWENLPHACFHVAIGNNALREKLCLAIGASKLISAIHPKAAVSRRAHLGAGCFVGACAVVNSGATVDNGAIINSGVIVEHHAHVEPFAHLSYGSIVGGGARVVARSLVPSGVVVNRGSVFGVS
jgi:sugar O-acyltransferase (sialic acid O-acetyltransferase NeuD family)